MAITLPRAGGGNKSQDTSSAPVGQKTTANSINSPENPAPVQRPSVTRNHSDLNSKTTEKSIIAA